MPAIARPLQQALRQKSVVEMRVFLAKPGFEQLLDRYRRKGLIDRVRSMTSYYFDSFEASEGRFALKSRPLEGGKWRFREKLVDGRRALVLQSKRRTLPTSFPKIDGVPFSVRHSSEIMQDVTLPEGQALLKRARKAAKAFAGGAEPEQIVRRARKAGGLFARLQGAFPEAFADRLQAVGGEKGRVRFAGALHDRRFERLAVETPEGIAYGLQLDHFTLATAPGQVRHEYGLEASLPPGATIHETKRRALAVMRDVARRLKKAGIALAELVEPKQALSDPLGPTGGYMRPVEAVLARHGG